MRSLRFRLPALFLAGLALAGLVSIAIAGRLFADFAHDQALTELKRESRGISELYQRQADIALSRGDDAPAFAAHNLEVATGDRLYYVGADPFPGGGNSGLKSLPQKTIDWTSGEALTFEFKPPGEERTFVAVAHPVTLGGTVWGALVVAKPQAQLRARWVRLSELLSLAFLIGIALTGTLAWYLSRRITRPVLALSRAADDVAQGHYDVVVPKVPGGGEVGHLAERFGEMAARLKEAEELERNFLMSVSHELRTPLTAIRGHVAALREGLVEDEDLREHSLETVEGEAARLERLVGDILDLAKLGARRFTVLHEEVDMEQLVDRAYSTFADEARRRSIDYHREIDAAPTITSDGDRLLQIISNLLSNAFRWTPDGGRIDVELAQRNGVVSVAVEDNGPGIDPSDQERIFRPFHSSDGLTGTGLGLAIARELSAALGGRLEVESEPGKGSRFELVLPSPG
jgi:two-component system sensor histidine kinase BaeS